MVTRVWGFGFITRVDRKACCQHYWLLRNTRACRQPGSLLRALHPATLRYTGFLHACPHQLGRTTYTGVKGSVLYTYIGSPVRRCLIPWLALTTCLLCSRDFYEEQNKLVRLWEKEEDGKSTFKFKLEVTSSN